MKNITIIQFFHRYYPEGGKLWQEVSERAEHLSYIGINFAWLPPAYKGASGGYSVGYDTYDLFDLGEFDQKGTKATKYGDKEGLLNVINHLKEKDIKVIFDVVFNHKMGTDIDFRNPAVAGELKYWAKWLLDSIPIDGFRLDAVKHIPAWFFKEWIEYVQSETNQSLLIIAEYWSPDIGKLQQYLDHVDGKLMLFDVALHHKFHEASKQGEDYDLSQIFNDTLIKADPFYTITLVANHDTQPLQSLETPVES